MSQARAILDGYKEAKRLLTELPSATQKRVARKAASAGVQPILKAARSGVPVDSGMLKRSLGKRVKRLKREPGTIAFVEARRKFSAGKKLAGTKAADRTPHRYIHLVHQGTKRGAAPDPFLERAVQSQKGTADRIVTTKAIEEVQREARKLGKP